MNALVLKVKTLFLSSVILSTSILFSSCSKDEDVNPVDRQQFLGYFQVEDKYDDDVDYYSIHITESSKGKDMIEISNFGDIMHVNIYAKVKGNKFTIYSQSFESSNKSYTMTLTGEGTLSGSTLAFNYTFFVDEKNDEDWSFGGQCTATKMPN